MDTEAGGVAVGAGTFGAGRATWLRRTGSLRNLVRQELVARQLAAHLGPPPAAVLDIGAGQGTQSVRLASRGFRVTAVEPDPQMRQAFQDGCATLPAAARERVSLQAGALGQLQAVAGGTVFDAVLLHGVLMYLPASEPALAEVSPLLAPGGLLSLVVRHDISTLWAPAARRDWDGALAAIGEWDSARAADRDVRYTNEIGSPARADRLDQLIQAAAALGLRLERWYGVRVATEGGDLDAPPPPDPEELARLLAVEERLASMDPFRHLSQLAHLVFRRRPGATRRRRGRDASRESLRGGGASPGARR